ncbi:MAG TPA: phage tail tip lysozyme, partial [bacterium]
MPISPGGTAPSTTFSPQSPVPDTVTPNLTEIAPPHAGATGSDNQPNHGLQSKGQDGFEKTSPCVTHAQADPTSIDHPVKAAGVKAAKRMQQQCEAPCTPCSGMQGKDTAAKVKGDLMNRYGLNNAQASAIMGNLWAESGHFQAFHQGSTKCKPGGEPTGYVRDQGVGWAQWTGPRNKNFFSKTASSTCKDPTSYAANQAQLFRDFDGQYKGVISDLKSGKFGSSMNSMTGGVMHSFENPRVQSAAAIAGRTTMSNQMAGLTPGDSGNAQGTDTALAQQIDENAKVLGGKSSKTAYQGSDG